MPFQKVQYTFPDEEEKNEAIEVENSSAIEVDISGETKEEVKVEPAHHQRIRPWTCFCRSKHHASEEEGGHGKHTVHARRFGTQIY